MGVQHIFGHHLRIRRTEAGYTLQSLAQLLGVSAVTLSDMERGRLPPFDACACQKISELLGCNAESFLFFRDISDKYYE